MGQSVARSVSKVSCFAALLLGLYLLSFSLPFLLAFKIPKLFFTSSELEEFSVEKLFSGFSSIDDARVYILTQRSPELLPKTDKDFLFNIWLRTSKNFQINSRVVFAAKTEGNSDEQDTYSLGLINDQGLLRPVVYFGNQLHGGKWYTFNALDFPISKWFMLTLSFIDNKYLGLHVTHYNNRAELKTALLGGYEVDPKTVPQVLAPLRIGSWGKSRFTGKVGPFNIIHTNRLDRKLSKLIEQFAKEPTQLPRLLNESEVAVWSPDTRTDLSANKLEIQLAKQAKK